MARESPESVMEWYPLMPPIVLVREVRNHVNLQDGAAALEYVVDLIVHLPAGEGIKAHHVKRLLAGQLIHVLNTMIDTMYGASLE